MAGTRDGAGDEVLDVDPLGWEGYPQLRAAARERAGTEESVSVKVEKIDGRDAVVVRWSFAFLGGSMGSVAGQRIAGAYDLARDRRLPVILRTSTGGARMQEGMASLVQMAATTVAARRHAAAGLVQVAVLGHPTTGGVFASHANLADVMLARRGAMLGFAGPRVAEALTGGPLPPHSHTARGAVAAGLVDAVVDDADEAGLLAGVLSWAAAVESARTGGWSCSQGQSEPVGPPSRRGERHAWEVVRLARHPDRARAKAWLDHLEMDMELHGDRAGGDDRAIRAALGRLGGAPVVVIALDRDEADGRVGPGGYRKAWRAMDIAERLGVPVVTLVDTKGADASAAAEAGGIASHIARTFARLLGLRVPTVSLVTGEGGSGGALALAVTDRLLMMEHATFSVIAPEGAAAILHRDASRAPEVARQLRPDAHTLLGLGVADEIVAESGDDPVAAGWSAVARHLRELVILGDPDRLATRGNRWRHAPSVT